MKVWNTIFLIPFLVLFSFTCSSGQNKSLDFLVCSVAIYGSEPHTYPGCTTESGQHFEFSGDFVPELRNKYQGKTLRLNGKVVLMPGPGMPGLFHVESVSEGVH